MIRSQPSVSEQQRLAALHYYNILDTPRDEVFDDIVDAVRATLIVPCALITFIDSDRQWFKASRGTDLVETSRKVAFCSHTILRTDPLVIEDATADERFRDNPFVVDDPRVRFYLGAPILTPSGAALGAVCAFDIVPRPAQNREVRIMKFFARQVLQLLELHKYRTGSNVVSPSL